MDVLFIYMACVYTTNTHVENWNNYNKLTCKLDNTLETSAFEELGLEFINFPCNCVINTLKLVVYLTGFSI